MYPSSCCETEERTVLATAEVPLSVGTGEEDFDKKHQPCVTSFGSQLPAPRHSFRDVLRTQFEFREYRGGL